MIAFVAGAGLVMSEDEARRTVVDPIVNALPLTDEGSADLRGALLGAGRGSAAVGILGFAGLLWTASGMFAAIRSA